MTHFDPEAHRELAAPVPGEGASPTPSRQKRFRLFPRFRRDRQGVAAIEFALLALPFFTIIFAILETGLVFLAELTLDQAVDQVARTVRTGEAQKAGMTEAQFKQAICDKVSFLLSCPKLKIDLSVYANFASIPAPSPSGSVDSSGFGVHMAGGETISALRVYYNWPIYTDLMRKYLATSGDGTQLLYSVAAFRTEPF
ncbi:TadE/TadG family type IV pilus assembly protein [Aureimonas sp. Leaf454]|uniref:TadE/TadG family type IV pilus assembly protein n=1 Tax=Aureimonas sp. Leaf454 TaxID=1736381 RepID=UPI00138F0D04|nr:TadE/TadG family type IV pilus assembly protein [Aureimonas sp. Leaf454]